MDALTPDGRLFGPMAMNTVLSRRVSLLSLSCLPSVPSPTTPCRSDEPSGVFFIGPAVGDFRRRRRVLADQSVLGFAIKTQARHGNRPNRVRQPTDRTFASGCSPPRLAATQLPSATENQTFPDGDSHPADTTTSQSHVFDPEGIALSARHEMPGLHEPMAVRPRVKRPTRGSSTRRLTAVGCAPASVVNPRGVSPCQCSVWVL